MLDIPRPNYIGNRYLSSFLIGLLNPSYQPSYLYFDRIDRKRVRLGSLSLTFFRRSAKVPSGKMAVTNRLAGFSNPKLCKEIMGNYKAAQNVINSTTYSIELSLKRLKENTYIKCAAEATG